MSTVSKGSKCHICKKKLEINSKLAKTTKCKSLRVSRVGSRRFEQCTLLVFRRIRRADYTVRKRPDPTGSFRANTRSKRFTHGCTRKFTIYLQFFLMSPHHAKIQTILISVIVSTGMFPTFLTTKMVDITKQLQITKHVLYGNFVQ